jgi:hypothetical protein
MEEEVKYDVDTTANDKAPGPHGFSRRFKACWSIIKRVVMAVIN